MSDKTVNPAPMCAACGRDFSVTGGCRLVAQTRKKVGKAAEPVAMNGPDVFSLCAALGDGGGYAYIQGEKHFCTPQALERVVQALEKGQTPWFCQRCGLRLCREEGCDAPLNRPVASDYITKDGRILHCAIFPADTGCSNPECNHYRKWKLL